MFIIYHSRFLIHSFQMSLLNKSCNSVFDSISRHVLIIISFLAHVSAQCVSMHTWSVNLRDQISVEKSHVWPNIFASFLSLNSRGREREHGRDMLEHVPSGRCLTGMHWWPFCNTHVLLSTCCTSAMDAKRKHCSFTPLNLLFYCRSRNQAVTFRS